MSKRVVHPAVDGRRTYNDQVSEALSSRFVLTTLALLAMLSTLAAVGGLIYVAAQSKFVPYVFEKCGRDIVPIGRAERADALDAEVVTLWKEGAIVEFVSNARLVTPDSAHQAKAIRDVYAFLSPGDAGFQRMNDWYNGEDGAMQRGERESVAVDVSSVLAQSEDTYQVDWVEHVLDADGSPKAEFRMRALVRVYRRAPTRETKEEDLRKNPFGLFVKDFSWGKQL